MLSAIIGSGFACVFVKPGPRGVSSSLLSFFSLFPFLLLSFFSLSPVNLIPITPIVEERLLQDGAGGIRADQGKSRKRVFPMPHTQEPNPISEAYGYCNTPNRTEQAWEGETCQPANTTCCTTKDCKPEGEIQHFCFSSCSPTEMRGSTQVFLNEGRHAYNRHLVLSHWQKKQSLKLPPSPCWEAA